MTTCEDIIPHTYSDQTTPKPQRGDALPQEQSWVFCLQGRTIDPQNLVRFTQLSELSPELLLSIKLSVSKLLLDEYTQSKSKGCYL